MSNMCMSCVCRGFPYNFCSTAPTGNSLSLLLSYRQTVLCCVQRDDGAD